LGHVKVLDKTYANCVNQTNACLFYAVAAGKIMLIYSADASNAFAEATPPKQGFFIHPDRAFIEWWTIHKGRPPIPHGHVIPINSAMQGHPKSPRLWNFDIKEGFIIVNNNAAGLAPLIDAKHLNYECFFVLVVFLGTDPIAAAAAATTQFGLGSRRLIAHLEIKYTK
jgi:hypothetical protein